MSTVYRRPFYSAGRRKSTNRKVYNIFINGEFKQKLVSTSDMQALKDYGRSYGVCIGGYKVLGECNIEIDQCKKGIALRSLYPCGKDKKCIRKICSRSAIGDITIIEDIHH